MKKSIMKMMSCVMSLAVMAGTVFLTTGSVAGAGDVQPAVNTVTFQKVGVVKLEYQIDGGQWRPVELKMKKQSTLKKPEITVSAYKSQEISLSKENLGKPIKFRADFIDTTEENAQPKLTGEECRVFDGVTKEDINVLKYTYIGDTEEENEASYNLSVEKVSGRNNAVMTVDIHFTDIPESGNNEDETPLPQPTEEGFAEMTPTITYTNIIENDAVAGAVVARISMPEGVDSTNIEYCFDESNTSAEAVKIRGMFEIRGNEIRIIDGFDTYEFNDSTLYFRTVSDRKYNDGKRHVKEDRNFWLGVYAKKNGVHSDTAYTYEGNQSNLVIGKHVEEAIDSDKQFHITKLEYYLGEKTLENIAESDWKSVDAKEVEKINATSGNLGEIADGYVAIPTERTFKQLKKDNLYIKVTTDRKGPVIYNNKHSNPLIGDVTEMKAKHKDGYAYGVISVMNGKGKDEIWRSFRIKVHPVSKFTSFVFENVEVSAEEGVLADGTRLLVKPIVGEELSKIKAKLGEDKLKSYISAEDISLISYSGEEVTIPQGKMVTVKIKKPESIDDKSIAVYHINADRVEKMDISLDEENHIVFRTASFSPFVIVADSTVGEDTATPDENATTRPDGNTTTGSDGNTTTRPDGDTTTGSDGNTTTRPDGNTTTGSDGNTTTRPDGNTTTGSDGNATTRPDGNTTTGSDGNTTTLTPDEGTTVKADADKTAKADADKSAKADADKTAKADADKTAKADAGKTAKADVNNSAKTPGNHTNTNTVTPNKEEGKAASRSTSPKTGDSSNRIYAGFMVSALLFMGAAARKKRA